VKERRRERKRKMERETVRECARERNERGEGKERADKALC